MERGANLSLILLNATHAPNYPHPPPIISHATYHYDTIHPKAPHSTTWSSFHAPLKSLNR